MNPAALSTLFLALALAACSQSEPPVPEFQTVTIAEPAARLARAGQSVPLPVRKPTTLASAPVQSQEPAVIAAARAAPGEQDIVSPAPIGPNESPRASSTTVASSQYASAIRYFKRWLPDFNQITNCPDGITCQAFAN
jgi:hypothetical protein